MRVFQFATGRDTAGQGAALRSAILSQRPAWRVDQMRRVPALGYPAQYEWDLTLARNLCALADVIHLCQTLRGLRLIRGRKRVVLNHHGTFYREHAPELDAACRARGVVQVASTVDLLGRPGVEWLPTVFDPSLTSERQSARGPIRIAHSPTDRTLKGTIHVEAAVRQLQAEGLPVELDLIERVPWRESVARKATADIFVDQMYLGYGLSAVEAWAYGMPVVAGVTDPTVQERMVAMWGALPFVAASPETLTDVLRELALDPALRARWGERGRDHLELYHSPAAVVERLAGIYDTAGAIAA